MDDQRPPGDSAQISLQNAYPLPEADYSVPLPGYSGAGPVDSPVQHQPVYNQPGGQAGVPWMPAPPPPSDCPPGLEYLTQVDEILIHQQIDLLEVIIHIETNNKYEIKNSLGQKIYFVTEDSNFCTRNTCGAHRPFTMRILDLMGREVITLERPLRCTSCCCCPCCLQEIKSLNEENVVGKISKRWTGFVREACTDYSDFDIQFPLDLDVKMKAVMLGACFLIVIQYAAKIKDTWKTATVLNPSCTVGTPV
ncbi:phospholipid scramblase 1-like isoform X2 [Eptesicus fuscus]|uniref:phospholipid scramblase 1-like isoform X2 n=1 Tax=Eptesicus fuscus TaxID=29078 RepID=UPI00240465D4|nr:phospholipid scramblase 1-like isoform X2 [Eptesicus fuscus]